MELVWFIRILILPGILLNLIRINHGIGIVNQNPNITMEIVKLIQIKPWNWDCVHQNPNITWDID